MKQEINLMQHEKLVVIEALRRDMRAEEALAFSDPRWEYLHKSNARRDKSVLEYINPKGGIFTGE